MTIGESTELQYPDFKYSLNSSKVLNIRDGDLEKVLKAYNVTTSGLDEMVASIREWYEKQPHLPQGQLHDRMIIGHLLTRGFSVEQAKEKIDNYFAARHRMPDILGNWEPIPANTEKYLKQGYWIIPPFRTPENHRVVIFRILNPEMVVLDAARIGFMMSDYRLFNETSQGDHWIFDLSLATLSHVIQFNPLLISKIYYHITSCYALKLKGIHLVNVPSFAHSVLALLKKIMKEKHVSRLHLYDSFDKIFNVLPRDVFPNDIGGTSNLTCQDVADTWYETLQSDTWKAFYKHQSKTFQTDESKRISSSKITDTFGVEGSFRKLDLD
ncbi:alpha-tocopherol transfer protein-like [Anticarsia gemmatalis]|uniref:alpha-tocopherol transfer protein-like n=1 Tax=Anticarsia gemmatalis TaxID=129554 RepID=UPI003F771A6F